MEAVYVENREGWYYVADTRVSLASIIYEYKNGATPEMIQQEFETLAVGEIQGVIAFYLTHREECEQYLRRLEEKWEALNRSANPIDPELQQRLDNGRKRLLARDA